MVHGSFNRTTVSMVVMLVAATLVSLGLALRDTRIVTAQTGVITIVLDAPGADDEEEFGIQVRGEGDECDEELSLKDGDSEQLTCPVPGLYEITGTALPAGWQLTDLSCTDRGIQPPDLEIDQSKRQVLVTFDDDRERLRCTFSYAQPAPTPTPTTEATPTATAPATTPTPSPVPISPPSTGSAGLTSRERSGPFLAYTVVLLFAVLVGSTALGKRRL